MQMFPPTIVWRHRKENLKKCSLRGLESRADFRFFSYPDQVLPDLSNYVLLTIDAPPLEKEDAQKGLVIIDGTWRYAEKMVHRIDEIPGLERRSIPLHYRTAYPRHQTDCPFPERGLASLEAIFIAYYILGRDTSNLLNNYYWKEQFCKTNNLQKFTQHQFHCP